jgi:hypothetical protein
MVFELTSLLPHRRVQGEVSANDAEEAGGTFASEEAGGSSFAPIITMATANNDVGIDESPTKGCLRLVSSLQPPSAAVLIVVPVRGTSLSYRPREKVTNFPRTGGRESFSRRAGTRNFSLVPGERESYDFPS